MSIIGTQNAQRPLDRLREHHPSLLIMFASKYGDLMKVETCVVLKYTKILTIRQEGRICDNKIY